jgi:serine/threonine-protein kinase
MLPSYLTDERRELWRSGLVTAYRVHSSSGACTVLRILRAGAPQDAFLHETTLLRELTHPHIVPLLEAGEAEGTLYQLHPDIDGTLEQLLQDRGHLRTAEAVTIARRIGEALSYLHSRGLVHCNVTPAAVWFLAAQPVLGKFELATLTGVLLTTPRGTLAYMSPEQARPGARIDATMDIYALGVVLHEMLTVTLPSSRTLGDAPGQSDRPPFPRFLQQHAPPVPESLQTVVRRAVAETLPERFASMELFLRALAAA